MAQLRLFAALREAAGIPAVQIPAATVAELLNEADARYGKDFAALAGAASVVVNMVAVNRADYERRRLTESDEVALLPPVSGGQDQTLLLDGRRTELLQGMGLLATVFVASLIGLAAVASVLAVLAFLAAMEMSRPPSASGPTDQGARSVEMRSLPVTGRVVVSSSAAALPLATVSSGEGAVLWASWVAIVALGVIALRSGPAGATEMIGRAVWVALFTGFLASFIAILHAGDETGRVLMAFLLVCALHGLAAAAATRMSKESTLGDLQGLSVKAGLAGVTGALAAGGLCVLILPQRFDLGPMLVIGLITGVAASLSQVTGRVIQMDITSGRRLAFPVLTALQPLLLAAPAFYYSLRLYLT